MCMITMQLIESIQIVFYIKMIFVIIITLVGVSSGSNIPNKARKVISHII